jgi:predicted CoA-substrate-specific enzyme activase
MSLTPLYLGIDVGSVSVNVALIDEAGNILREDYLRHKGHPMRVAAEGVQAALAGVDPQQIKGIATTGTVGRIVARLLGGVFVNEVVAQAAATSRLHPEVRTTIEIGGEDSKLIFLASGDGAGTGSGVADFAMNTMCAAGTGSFLDQQATRLGLTIEEFGQMSLKSVHPPRVAGRCSVFAKSDMIHLQQKATPDYDIVAGLCFALARNFKSTVGSATTFKPPISFQGGVAANPGIIRALESVLELPEGGLVIPEHFAAMGAIGAVYQSMGTSMPQPNLAGLDELAAYAAHAEAEKSLQPLKLAKSVIMDSPVVKPERIAGERIPAYLGVDIGSISTNVLVMDKDRNVLSKRYLMTAGRPIEAVRQGLLEVGEEVADLVDIRGVCTTGSGRYLIADFIGADVVKNEITAQARGALQIDPKVDTIFEIGGQDSKYISLENGHVVDFEMNKVCAAGTGSFLEEQAEKLGISIKGEFSDLALKSQQPVNLGERCTVFMETELLRHQQMGASTEDLVAGLAYSVGYNYLNRVVARKKVGDRIFFQGGTAFNQAVVAAFEMITGRPITVPSHNEVTGALGCAVIALEEDKGTGSKFKGFDLTKRAYEVESFECQDCPNHCEINKVTVEGEQPLYYGSRCEKYDVDRSEKKRFDGIPDLFAEREKLLLKTYEAPKQLPEDAPRVGMPRALLFHELYPFWAAFFGELGCKVVLSDRTNKSIIHEGAEQSVAETCFPVKVALGHALNLTRKKIDYAFLPSIINLEKMDEGMTDSFVCPYVQSFTYTVRSAVDFAGAGIKVMAPQIWMQLGIQHRTKAMAEVGTTLGKSAKQVRDALIAAEGALAKFQQDCRTRGEEVLRDLDENDRAIVVVSRSYNGCDPGANLEIPRKLRQMGVLAIPLDFLPLDKVKLPENWSNMYWRYGQKILGGAELIANDKRLYPLYLTNFGCGPDSFVTRFFSERLGEKPCLIIEVDEHSADAGIITRCEAFLDSLDAAENRDYAAGRTLRRTPFADMISRTVYIPNMSGHAYALKAAFEACGMAAEVMDEADEDTLFWGRKYTTGKECFPCIVTTGDMVKYAKRPDFDRGKSCFFMGGSGGPCRLGQYNTLQRMVLDELGYEDVPIFAPNQASKFYDELGMVGRDFVHIGWRGVVAIDVLEKALLETRPYEIIPGSTDKAYLESRADACRALAERGDLIEAMRRSRKRFDAVEVDRSEQRPIVGMVGEFYVRANAYSNQDLVRQIEALGGEVWASPIYEWFLYRNFRRDMRAKLVGDWKVRVTNNLKNRIMIADEHKIIEPFKDYLRNAEEPPTEDVLDLAADYVHCSFEGEAIMTVGKAIDFAEKGLAGIVAVMPFTCMPGTVSHAIMKRVRGDQEGIPYINMVYDGTSQSTALTRLEAFMYQAKEYAARNGKAPAGVAAH